jgi:hypothetical protein
MGLETSICLAKEDLAVAKTAARRDGLSLSAFLAKLIRAHAEEQAKIAGMERFLRTHARGYRLTDDARRAIEAEWRAPLPPVRSRRRRAAA